MGMRMRLTMNPGMSLESTVVLPIRSARARVTAYTESLVWAPRMISTSCITGTGFMKCIPMTRSGAGTLAAIRATEMEEGFVARTASCGSALARAANTFFFTSSFSVTASTANSAPRASSTAPAFRRPIGAGLEQLVQAAVGGALATPRARREATARGLQELVSSGALADSAAVDRSVHLARCPPQVAHALDLGGLAPSELWCADVPLSVESDAAGMLRLVLDREPRRSLLRALRGVGHEASLQLAQERGRQRAVSDLALARQNLGTLAAAAAS